MKFTTKETQATARIQDGHGRSKLHRKIIITVPALGESLRNGFMKLQDTNYRYNDWFQEQYEANIVKIQMMICINRKTGEFTLNLARRADNLEMLVAKGRKHEEEEEDTSVAGD